MNSIPWYYFLIIVLIALFLIFWPKKRRPTVSDEQILNVLHDRFVDVGVIFNALKDKGVTIDVHDLEQHLKDLSDDGSVEIQRKKDKYEVFVSVYRASNANSVTDDPS